MLVSYLQIALRSLFKHRLYAAINLAGLALGLCVFLFSVILVHYERNHDSMFERRARIFTVGSVFAPTSEEPVVEYPVARTVYGPWIEAAVPEADAVARAIHREVLLQTAQRALDIGVRFADRDFARIFDFRFMHGDPDVLSDPRALILTESTARKLFGTTAVLGRRITIERRFEARVAAVIEDVGVDSHFNSSFLPDFEMSVIGTVEALVALGDFDRAGDWHGLNPADMTYILLPADMDLDRLAARVDAVYERHTPAGERDYISSLKVRPLIEANIVIWDSMGFPVLETVSLLGLLVLLVASANYTNLATAQNFGRTREVGLRRAIGARPHQLWFQFLTESLVLVACAMLVALSGVEVLVPLYNELTGRVMHVDHVRLLPMIAGLIVGVGLLAGSYPAFLIARQGALDSLRGVAITGRRGAFFRGGMITVQFTISIFILSLVLIVVFQNQRVLAISETWPKRDIVVLDRVEVAEVRERQGLLRSRLHRIPGVAAVSFSSAVPFFETSRTQASREVSPVPGGTDAGFELDVVAIDPEFRRVFDIELLHGRALNPESPDDTFDPDRPTLNVIVNQLTAERLGFGRDVAALGRTFHKLPDERSSEPRTYTIVGLVPDKYFIGPHSKIRPMAFFLDPNENFYLSLRLHSDDHATVLSAVDAVWSDVVPDYPVRRRYLDDYFRFFFKIPVMIGAVIAAFAAVALALALIGLFGLAAFLARRRTKEIGIRKVMGAGVGRIVVLLVWQFLRPVLVSLFLAAPAAYFASKVYLDFYPERIGFIVPVILLSSVLAVAMSALVVVGHAVRIASQTPARALRYE